MKHVLLATLLCGCAGMTWRDVLTTTTCATPTVISSADGIYGALDLPQEQWVQALRGILAAVGAAAHVGCDVLRAGSAHLQRDAEERALASASGALPPQPPCGHLVLPEHLPRLLELMRRGAP